MSAASVWKASKSINRRSARPRPPPCWRIEGESAMTEPLIPRCCRPSGDRAGVVAMGLPMFGVFRGDQPMPAIDGSAIWRSSALHRLAAPPARRRLRRHLCRRWFRARHEAFGPVRLGGIDPPVGPLLEAEKSEKFEYPILVLLATIGMMMLVSANDLISLYMGLELMSLALYVVAAIDRDMRARPKPASNISSSAVSSGMLLYGASLIYGFTGTGTSPRSPPRTPGAPVRRSWAHLWLGIPFRRPLLQGVCGAVPHVDAGCL